MNVNFGQLWSCIEDWDNRLDPFRANYIARIRKFVGFRYSDDGFPIPQPVNLVAIQNNIVSNHLVSNNPQAYLRARPISLRPYAKTFEISYNNRLSKMKLGRTLNSAVRQALSFGQAFVKIGWTQTQFQIGNGRLGGIYCELINPDDLIVDMYASNMEEITFIGNRYRLPLEAVQNSPIFNSHAKDAVESSGYAYSRGRSRASEIASGTGYAKSIVPMVDLIDGYLPYHNRFVTLFDNGDMEPIRNEEWRGRVGGPYKSIFRFIEVPSNLIGLAPVAITEDLADSVNMAITKTTQGIEDFKELLLAPMAARADAEEIRNAKNGDVVPVTHMGGVTSAAYGGPNQGVFGVGQLWINLFMELAGNLRTLGGLSQQAGTLGQEELLVQSANKLIDAMQETVIEDTSEVMADIAYLHWYSKETDIVTKQVGKSEALSEFGIVNPATGEVEHEGEWDDYSIQIIPWSLTRKSPAQRMASITQLMMQILLPAAPLMQQQGIGINFPGYIELRKRLLDEGPELDEILTRMDPQGAADQMPDVGASAASFSHRVYERKNTPSASRQQQDQMMANIAFGGNAQDAEKASLVRSA